MKGVWGILAAAFLLFFLVSATDGDLSIGGYSPRRSDLYAALLASPFESLPQEPASAEPERQLPADSVDVLRADSLPIQAEPDTLPKTILLFGDSMLEGISPRLAAYCKAAGHQLYTVIWYSSTSERWGTSDRLRQYITKVKPDYIFISLGANELFVRDIAAKRTKYVKKILQDIGDIPYIWIGPPNWKEDTGINRMIADNAAAGSFFLTDGMHFDRKSDGAHPTAASASRWVDSIVRWMPGHAVRPLRLGQPATPTARPVRIFIHQPNE